MYQANNSSQDKTRQRNDIQREMIMKDGDYKKILSGKINLEAEIRSLRKEGDRIKMEIQVKEKTIQGIDQKAMMMANEIKTLKKKMNTL